MFGATWRATRLMPQRSGSQRGCVVFGSDDASVGSVGAARRGCARCAGSFLGGFRAMQGM